MDTNRNPKRYTARLTLMGKFVPVFCSHIMYSLWRVFILSNSEYTKEIRFYADLNSKHKKIGKVGVESGFNTVLNSRRLSII